MQLMDNGFALFWLKKCNYLWGENRHTLHVTMVDKQGKFLGTYPLYTAHQILSYTPHWNGKQFAVTLLANPKKDDLVSQPLAAKIELLIIREGCGQ